MTKLEQAARQALGALEVATTPLAKDRQEVLRAITTLREALSGVQALSTAPAEQEEAAQRLRKTLDIDPGDVNDPLHPRYIAGFKSGHAAGRRRAAPAASPTPPAEQQATKETSGGFHVWRDISTAPKDGSRFVATGHNYGLYSEVRHICVAQWFLGCWMEASDWNETSELKYLTHWMPLPSPPDDVAAPAEQQAQPDECFPGEPKVAVPQGLISAACFAIRKKRDGGKVLEQLRRYSVGDRSQPLAPQQAAPKAAPGEPDPADIIAGALQISRGHAIEMMREALEAAPQQGAQEPVAVTRFNCWSTNEGDSWFDHPADSKAIYDCLGNDAKVGDEYELTAGWTSVTARYRITEVVGDGEEYEVECISHPHENSAPQPAPAPLSEMPYEKRKAIQEGEQIGASDAWFKARHEMLDTVDRRNVFRAGFDRGWNAAIAAQGGKV